MKVHQILTWLNELAPFESAEGFDNVGLLMGDLQADIHSVVFGMDITPDLAQKAIDIGAELIITHHPFIFHAMKRIDYTCPQGQTLAVLAQHRMNVIAAHTNWDKAPSGVGDSLAKALELQDVSAGDEYVRVGFLPTPLSVEEFSHYIVDKLRIVPRIYAPHVASISRVAVAGGAYGEGYLQACASGAQIYVVGEVAHHEILDACQRGLAICDAGHFATEWPGVQALYHRFVSDAQSGSWAVTAHLHTVAPYPGAFLA